MFKSLLILAFVSLAFISSPYAMEPLNNQEKPTIAVFHADWCGSCKILDPKMEEAVNQLSDKDAIHIVKFDLTDGQSKAKSADLAAKNGLSDLYNSHAPKTGFVILVGPSAEEHTKITKVDSVEVIKEKLELFIATQS